MIDGWHKRAEARIGLGETREPAIQFSNPIPLEVTLEYAMTQTVLNAENQVFQGSGGWS